MPISHASIKMSNPATGLRWSSVDDDSQYFRGRYSCAGTIALVLLLASSSSSSCEAFFPMAPRGQPYCNVLRPRRHAPTASRSGMTKAASTTALGYYPDNTRDYRRRQAKKRTRYVLDDADDGSASTATVMTPRGGARGTNKGGKAKGARKQWQRSRSRHGRFGKERFTGEERLQRAEDVESRLLLALEGMKSVLNPPQPKSAGFDTCSDVASTLPSPTPEHQRRLVIQQSQPLVFPSVRECNAALAAFGDDGELLRALRLFVKMRKAASLASQAARGSFSNRGGDHRSAVPGHVFFYPPAPTLVTYSTLMSRAVQLGKAPVALRLWKLMKSQKEYFAKDSSGASSLAKSGRGTFGSAGAPIVPDVKALNILMNVHAKLSDPQSARDLLEQMLDPLGGPDVPPVSLGGAQPNVVTWNTLIDAYHLDGDLTSALDALEDMRSFSPSVLPDARTYTSLIATVARRRTARPGGGARDPDLAFTLLEEMKEEGVRPNGVTYCALIDACGRCGRSDLALKGLRMMLRQKAEEDEERRASSNFSGSGRRKYNRGKGLENEVGAWTAAIDACGRSGRVDTAVQLFRTMPKFGVKPNAITCGCLTDRLLKAGSGSGPDPTSSSSSSSTSSSASAPVWASRADKDGNEQPAPRIAETLEVLRYMKEEGIEPSEVMYTSLMSCAGRLAKMESRIGGSSNMGGDDRTAEGEEASAIAVYTELMRSLMQGGGGGGAPSSNSNANSAKNGHSMSAAGDDDDPHTLLLKVHLVFQEMTARGVSPDLACYNALLRACGRAGDVDRIRSVLKRVQSEAKKANIVGGDGNFDVGGPNDTTWREALRGAAVAGDSEAAQEFWDMARESHRDAPKKTKNLNGTEINNDVEGGQKGGRVWSPDAASFEALVEAHVRDGSSMAFGGEKRRIYGRAVDAYRQYVRNSDNSDDAMSPEDVEKVKQNPRAVLLVLRAAVSVELMSQTSGGGGGPPSSAREIAAELSALDCVREGRMQASAVAVLALDDKALKALELARSWDASS